MRLSIFLFAAMLVASPATASESIFEAQRYRPSKRHPWVVLAPRRGLNATLLIQLRVGSYDDDSNPGLTRVSQFAALAGQPGSVAEKLRREVYQRNATLTVSQGPRTTTFELSAQRLDFERLARLLLKAVFSAAPSSGDIEFARGAAVGGSSQSFDEAWAVALVATTEVDRLSNSTPVTTNITEGIIDGLVRKHIAATFVPANAVVVVTGAFDRSAMKRDLAQIRGGRAMTPVDRVELPATETVIHGEREVHLTFFSSEQESTEADATAILLTATLDELLLLDMRQQGLAYGSSCTLLRVGWLSGLLVVLPLRKDAGLVADPAVRAFMKDFAVGLTLADVDRNRSFLLAELARVNKSSLELARRLLVGATTRPVFTPALVDALKRVELGTLKERSKSLLSPERATRIRLTTARQRSTKGGRSW